MHRSPRPLIRLPSRSLAALAILLVAAFQACADGLAYRSLFEREVDRRLAVPEVEQAHYATLLVTALREQDRWPLASQFFVLVDRAPTVQAVLLYWQSGSGAVHFIGASPCSTGKPGRYEYFETPLGVFEHRVGNPDFRAEGTCNAKGVRGYGVRGMRVFDFGWVEAPRGWGDRHPGQLRLQMHATDPKLLEPGLGAARSKGCVRIPATLNRFLDHYGILDADYERAAATGTPPRVLSPSRQPTPWPGRFLVVTDTARAARPAWAKPATQPTDRRRTP